MILINKKNTSDHKDLAFFASSSVADSESLDS